ncbi:MAG: Hsp20/alpha crystallin family protein, partial [Fimbriimonadales bacterium]|nr:Hsp20/alpha crystallin family protein [Fimbriimonadales bacterium]
ADGFLLKAEIAGVRGEDIQVTYTPDTRTLTIRGERREETIGRRGVRCYQLEVYYGEFEREVELPDSPIDSEGIRAQYRNGFLIVFVPKIRVACDR